MVELDMRDVVMEDDDRLVAARERLMRLKVMIPPVERVVERVVEVGTGYMQRVSPLGGGNVMGAGRDARYWRVGVGTRERRFWPSTQSLKNANKRAKGQGLDFENFAIKCALREHGQKRTDRGEIIGPTRWEMWIRGVDIDTWNDGDGYFVASAVPVRDPKDHPELKRLSASGVVFVIGDDGTLLADGVRVIDDERIQGTLKKVVGGAMAIAAKEAQTISGEPYVDMKGFGPKPELYTAVKNIVETGNVLRRGAGRPRSKNSAVEDGDKPDYTGRRWRGEHWNPSLLMFDPPASDARTRYVDWYGEFLSHPDYPLGKCHEEWGERLEKSKHSINEEPRDHLKTYFFTIGYSLYQALENPDQIATRGILIICWDVGLAEESYLAIKQMLAENEKIKKFYGYIIDETRTSTKEKMFFVYQAPSAKNPGLFCSSLKGGHITGTHPSIVFIDDPQDEPLEMSMMRKFRTIINKKIIPAVGKEGRIIITGTTKGWTEDNDVYIWLEGKKMFQVYRNPAEIHGKMPRWEDVKYELKERQVIGIDGKPTFKVTGEPEVELAYAVTWVKDEEQYQTLYPERYTIRDLIIKRLEMTHSKTKSDDDFWSEYFLQARSPQGAYFNMDRISYELPTGLYKDVFSWKQLSEYCHEHHVPVIAWMDPGGETSHGVAISVMAKIKRALSEIYLIFDFVLIKAPLPGVAKRLAALMEQWGIDRVGCEGNFEQRECYAHTIDRELYREMEKAGALKYYHPIHIRNNTSEKMQRISTRFNMMLGLPSDPKRVHVNPNAEALENFMMQSKMFGSQLTRADKHEFDLLDSTVCADIHMLAGGVGRPFAIAAG